MDAAITHMSFLKVLCQVNGFFFHKVCTDIIEQVSILLVPPLSEAVEGSTMANDSHECVFSVCCSSILFQKGCMA